MTNWKAVITGFLVILLAGVVGAPLGVGPFVAGLIGGFVGGYMAGGGFVSGGWHGLLAGSVGGILLSVALAVLVTVLTIFTGPLALIGGAGVLVFGVANTFLAAAESAVAGAVGAAIQG